MKIGERVDPVLLRMGSIVSYTVNETHRVGVVMLPCVHMSTRITQQQVDDVKSAGNAQSQRFAELFHRRGGSPNEHTGSACLTVVVCRLTPDEASVPTAIHSDGLDTWVPVDDITAVLDSMTILPTSSESSSSGAPIILGQVTRPEIAIRKPSAKTARKLRSITHSIKQTSG